MVTEKVLHKIRSYHVFMQLGLIAQGLVQYLAIHATQTVWLNFGTWLRTIRKNVLPSEKVVSMALQNTYVEFLITGCKCTIFEKFLRQRIDLSQLLPSIVENIEKKEAA